MYIISLVQLVNLNFNYVLRYTINLVLLVNLLFKYIINLVSPQPCPTDKLAFQIHTQV